MNQASLAGLVEPDLGEVGRIDSPTPSPVAGPLSLAQEALWYRDRLNGASSTYNVAHAVRFRGPLDVVALRAALQALVARHGCLRTRFEERAGEPCQVVLPAVEIPLPVDDRTGIDDPDGTLLEAALRSEADRPFDLGTAPLLRVRLYRLGPEDHVFQYVMHHIVTDGWSSGIFAEDVARFYRQALEGREDERAPRPGDEFLEVVRRQRERLAGGEMQERVDWWRQRLANLAPLELPADGLRSREPTDAGVSLPVSYDEELVARLRRLAREQRVTLFTLLLAAFEVLIHRMSGARDIAVGVPTAGRDGPDEEAMIGFFVNMVVMRAQVQPELPFDAFLRQLWQDSLDALEYRDVPFEKLVAELSPARELNRHPIFQVSFALQNTPGGGLQLHGLAAEPMPAPVSGSHFDLTLTLIEDDRTLRGYLEYRTDLFESATVEHLAAQYRQLLRSICDAPSTPVDRLALVDPEEANRLLQAGLGRSRRDWSLQLPASPGLKTLLERQAEATPGAIAVSEGKVRFTYRELHGRANQVAHWLHARGIGSRPDTVVGVCLPRSALWVLALLGTIKAGCAYVPLDPELPTERLNMLVKDSGAVAVLAALSTAHVAAAAVGSASIRILTLDETEGDLVDCPRTPVPISPPPHALAYVMYTSGSTGKPKGVLVECESIVRLVMDVDYIRFTPQDRVAQASHAAFDAATFEVWGALLNGAELVVIERETLLSGPLLARRLVEARITTMFLTTALFNAHAHEHPDMFRTLDTLMIGGEACDPESVHRVLRHGPPRRLLNGYGPTETTTFATWYPFYSAEGEGDNFPAPHRTARTAESEGSAGRWPTRYPIGRPLGYARCHVLDARGAIAPVGHVGELYIGGSGVGRGYLNDPELTEARFVEHPLVPGERLYRSGDLARLRPDGCIDYLGRADRQVKLRGFRIEPIEIESTLTSLAGVARAAVIVDGDDGAGQRQRQYLHAFVVPAEPMDEPPKAWRRELERKLPAHAVPSRITLVDHLPVTSNGKLDERALAAMGRAAADAGKSAAPSETDGAAEPATPMEARLLKVWRELLQRPTVGVEDDFIEVGGHSLLALRLIAAIERETGVTLPLSAMLAAPTVRLQAALISGADTRVSGTGFAVPVRAEGSRPPLFLVSGYGGTALTFKSLANALGPDQPLYVLDTSLDAGDQAFSTLEELAAALIADMRRIQPRGPYRLCGHSLGGNIAWEISRQLQAAGEPPGLLVLLDCNAPGYPRQPPLPVRLVLKAIVAARQGPAQFGAYLRARYQGGVRRLLGRAPPIFMGEDADLYGNVGRELEQASAATYKLWERYVPGPWEGRVHVVRATQRVPEPGVRDDDPGLGWGRLAAGGVALRSMDCRHAEMCRAAQSHALAEQLLSCLADADALTGT